ncbi:group I truncated hemoglobin [Chitinimonas sp. BJB300]|uniref:group I truncated hemoglobin n=1 Tax=Chitinimonas sp. BJB300 TaxID=1559339 RepID=UPI0013040F6F|nr:group 1 truncated hemoglobin [Chitinimonas sp. BJB300]
MFYRLCCLCIGTLFLVLPARADSLYERLGGEAGVSEIASEMLDLTASAPQTRRTFDKVNMPRLKQKVAEHICSLTGGPCQYSGDTMKQSHAGMGITESELNGMVEHLRTVLDARHVAQADKNALLAILAPMKRDIVEIKR